MYSSRYPNCGDWEKHQQEGRDDARYHSHSHEPNRWDNTDCHDAYRDARRSEANRIEEREQERQHEEYEQARLDQLYREADQLQDEEEYLNHQEDQQQPPPESLP